MNLFSGLEKFGIKATDSTDLYADEKAAEKKTKEKVETAEMCIRDSGKYYTVKVSGNDGTFFLTFFFDTDSSKKRTDTDSCGT